eukprot:TRINITY_DN931_c0_g2_i8.p1 TRINITY_DN931_c0_g2~~TRINITY_DN931_c0_g2_i8.p1  ORF type:complete len:185 (-),score=53.43 TRINITY_DN931_c0_g2_i8:322-846(-)
MALWQAYVTSLEKRPLLTKAITSGVLSTGEEYCAQKLTSSKRDLERVTKMGLYGLLVSGPLGHFLYKLLDDAFSGKTGAVASILKLVAVNTVVLPIQNFVYLVAIAAISKGVDPAAISAAVKTNFWPIMKTTWKYFPLIQLFTFRFLPPNLWLPFFNTIGFLYGVYINWKAKKI